MKTKTYLSPMSHALRCALFLLLLASAGQARAACAPPPSGLLAWWPGEGNAQDIIGANNGYVLTLEDNYGGGIGSAVADAITESGDSFTLQQMFVRRIPKSAKTPEEMLQMCGLTAQDICKTAMKMLQVV